MDSQMRNCASKLALRAPRNDDGGLPVTVETVIAVIVTTAMTVTMVGNAEHTLDRTNGPADTGTDNTSDRTAHRPGDPVAFIRALLGAAHDALGMAGLRQQHQSEEDGSGCEQQADGQTGRQLRGGDTSFIHLQSQGNYTA
jgi:hypothetical protein